jgi:hypothetical protein
MQSDAANQRQGQCLPFWQNAIQILKTYWDQRTLWEFLADMKKTGNYSGL